MKKKMFPIIMSLILTYLIVSTPTASAAGLIPCGDSGYNNRCTLCDIIKLGKEMVDFGLKFLIIVAITAITIGGVMYILSAGSETNITRAKAFLSASITGFAIVLAAWLIVSIVLFLISAKTDLGIGQSSWYNFDVECGHDPAQSEGGGGGGGGGGGW